MRDIEKKVFLCELNYYEVNKVKFELIVNKICSFINKIENFKTTVFSLCKINFSKMYFKRLTVT